MLEEGGIDKMHKLDSFIRETERLDGVTLCSLDPFPVVAKREMLALLSFQ